MNNTNILNRYWPSRTDFLHLVGLQCILGLPSLQILVFQTPVRVMSSPLLLSVGVRVLREAGELQRTLSLLCTHPLLPELRRIDLTDTRHQSDSQRQDWRLTEHNWSWECAGSDSYRHRQHHAFFGLKRTEESQKIFSFQSVPVHVTNRQPSGGLNTQTQDITMTLQVHSHY